MNQALTVKICADLNPCYSMTNEELLFLYEFGELAIKLGINPLLFLTIDRRSRKANVQGMADLLLDKFQQKLGEELKLVKTKKDLTKIISITLAFDHAYVAPIKTHLGGFTMTTTVLTVNQQKEIEIKTVNLPIKTFTIGKGDTTAARNAEEIQKVMDSIMCGEHKTSFGISGDGAIIKQGLIQLMNDKYGEKLFPNFGTVLFPCLSHFSFLGWNHSVYLAMDDCQFNMPTFFPNHNPQKGKNIFFFGDKQEKESFCSYFKYWLQILKNLDTPSHTTNIKMGDYILELQSKYYQLEIKTKKGVFGAAQDQQRFKTQINAMIQDKLTTADYVSDYLSKYFGTQLDDENGTLSPKVVKVRNDPGKKCRRTLEMCEKLSKVANFADTIVKRFFSDQISLDKIPSTPFPSSFLRKKAQFVAIQKYLLSINDAASAFNCSLYRNVCVVSKAAFNLDEQDQKFYHEVLDNELLG